MPKRHILAVATVLLSAVAISAPQPIERFARRPQFHGVTISKDGRYIAFLSGTEDDTVLMTFDRTTGGAFKRVTASEPNKFDIGWCRWANEKRLLCGLYGNIRGKKYAEPPFKRLFSVDADGTALKVLEQPRNDGNMLGGTTSIRNLNMNYGPNVTTQGVAGGQSQAGLNNQVTVVTQVLTGDYSAYAPERQDNVIDLTPADDDTVLIQADDDRNTYPGIFRLNVYNGQRDPLLAEKPPIQTFVSDGRGKPRFGWGAAKNRELQYFARVDGPDDWWKSEWKKLDTAQASAETGVFQPIGLAAYDNSAFALGTSEGRTALWSIDLADARPPKLLFKHPRVDLGEPILQSDGQLLGVRYDVERPFVWYADPKLREIVERLERRTVTLVYEVVDSSADRNILVLRARGPADEGTYYLYEIGDNRLHKLGTAYPDLEQASLGTMTSFLYKAADGTEIPAFLTIPSGAEKKNLPLIVMPHDGPAARDSWKFSFLRTFLANRGYAVLQMNYRGSAGYGTKWSDAGQADGNALSYSDIQDATRWAVSEGIADPKRVCIMGWGFGGYEALLSAARNGETYRCAVSIAGIADLDLHQEQAEILGTNQGRREAGAERDKLKREAPLANAAKINIPVLLVHGTKDWQVQVDHTEALDSELKKNKKAVTTVIIKNAGHDLERKSDRITLLKSVEDFLAENLAAR